MDVSPMISSVIPPLPQALSPVDINGTGFAGTHSPPFQLYSLQWTLVKGRGAFSEHGEHPGQDAGAFEPVERGERDVGGRGQRQRVALASGAQLVEGEELAAGRLGGMEGEGAIGARGEEGSDLGFLRREDRLFAQIGQRWRDA